MYFFDFILFIFKSPRVAPISLRSMIFVLAFWTECPPCDSRHVRFRSCDERGHNQLCVSGYYLLPLCFVAWLMIVWTMKVLAPPFTPRHVLILNILICTVGVLNFSTDLLFVISTELSDEAETAVVAISWLLISLFMVSNLILGLLLPLQTKLDWKTRFKESESAFALAMILCLLDHRVMATLTSVKEVRHQFFRRAQKIRFAYNICMGAMQLYVVLTMSFTSLCVAVTGTSILLGLVSWFLEIRVQTVTKIFTEATFVAEPK
jgi:hypothetical protein